MRRARTRSMQTRTTHGQDPETPAPIPANETLESALIVKDFPWLRWLCLRVNLFMSRLPVAVSRFQLQPGCEQQVTMAPPSPRPRLRCFENINDDDIIVLDVYIFLIIHTLSESCFWIVICEHWCSIDYQFQNQNKLISTCWSFLPCGHDTYNKRSQFDQDC